MSENSERDAVELGDGMGDWRFRFVQNVMRNGRLARMSVFGELQAPNGDTFTFTDCMFTALYLNLAMTAEAKANALRPLIAPEQFDTPSGPNTSLRDENLGLLFDYIEQSAFAAIMSFLALEAYANFVISFELRDRCHVLKSPRQPKQAFSAEEIERCGETLEKLKTIVPQLLKVDPPIKQSFWPKLWEMKRVRDALVHLKFRDQMGAASSAATSRGGIRTDPDHCSSNLFGATTTHFHEQRWKRSITQPQGTPRWLLYPLSVYGMPATEPKGTSTVTISTSIR